jgi:hypothetical protein
VLEEYVRQVESQFAVILDEGSDDDLAISSYLHGHFDILLAKVDVSGTTIEGFNSAFIRQLNDALAGNELEEDDQNKAREIWRKINAFAY